MPIVGAFVHEQRLAGRNAVHVDAVLLEVVGERLFYVQNHLIDARMLLHESKARSKGFETIAGVDEAGRGSLAGPVVASAVILKRTDFASEINDSKKLTPKRRLKAFSEIKNKADVGIGIVAESVIDDLAKGKLPGERPDGRSAGGGKPGGTQADDQTNTESKGATQ